VRIAVMVTRIRVAMVRQTAVRFKRTFRSDLHLEGGCPSIRPKETGNVRVAKFLGGPSETRTPDPLIKSQLLYQLS
jgi:hypothetical protein